MNKEILKDLTGSFFDWSDPKNINKVIKGKAPQLNPPLHTYFKRKVFSLVDEAPKNGQLTMFDDSPIINTISQCSLGTFENFTDIKSFNKAVDKLIQTSTFVAVDIETTGVDPFTDKIRTIQLCGDGKHSLVALVNDIGEAIIDPISRVLENSFTVFQNGDFDCSFMAVHWGLFPSKYIFDTIIAAQVCDAGFFEARDKAFGLGSLCKRYLDLEIDKSAQKSFIKDKITGKVLPLTQDQLKYAANDTIATFRLAVVLANELLVKGVNKAYRELDHLCIAPVVDIKLNGAPVDQDYLNTLEDKLKPEVEFLQHKIAELLNLTTPKDVDSNQKLLVALQKDFPKLDSTGESALVSYFLGREITRPKPDHKAQVKQQCEAVGLLLEYRKLSKMVSTFISGYKSTYLNPTTKKLHPRLNICGSMSEEDASGGDIATGRFSCTSPNLLAFPADQKYRDVFRAPEGYVYLKVDASQQEVRVLADVSNDPELQDIYINESVEGADIYTEVASKILKKKKEDITKKERSLFKCLSGNTIVSTAKGFKRLKDVNVLDCILNTHRTLCPISHVTSSTRVVWELCTSKGIVYGTPDHKFYEPLSQSWKELKDFQTNDYIQCDFTDYLHSHDQLDHPIDWHSIVEKEEIPIEIFNGSINTRLRLIAEAMNYEGRKITDYWVRINIVSPKLCSDICQILSSLCAHHSIYRSEERKCFFINVEEAGGNLLKKLGINQYLDFPEKFFSHEEQNLYPTAGRAARVISVRNTKNTETVYDIGVLHAEEFMANSLRTHNCIVLGINYSAGAAKIAAMAEIPEDKAKEAINAYYNTFINIKQFIRSSEDEAKKQKFLHNSYSKRRRNWNHEYMVEKGLEFKYKTTSANFKIQSASADCSKKAFILAYEKLGAYGCRPMPPVHDELVWIAPIERAEECLQILADCMIYGSHYWMRKVPMRVEGIFGHTWRKDKYLCDICEKEYDPDPGICTIEQIDNKYKIVCKECKHASITLS